MIGSSQKKLQWSSVSQMIVLVTKSVLMVLLVVTPFCTVYSIYNIEKVSTGSHKTYGCIHIQYISFFIIVVLCCYTKNNVVIIVVALTWKLNTAHTILWYNRHYNYPTHTFFISPTMFLGKKYWLPKHDTVLPFYFICCCSDMSNSFTGNTSIVLNHW